MRVQHCPYLKIIKLWKTKKRNYMKNKSRFLSHLFFSFIMIVILIFLCHHHYYYNTFCCTPPLSTSLVVNVFFLFAGNARLHEKQRLFSFFFFFCHALTYYSLLVNHYSIARLVRVTLALVCHQSAYIHFLV